MANTIQDKLAYLEETKGLIKQAIVAKGVDVSDTDTFRSYANKIEAIQSGGGGTVNLPDGTKFAYSTFTTVPDSFIPYLETQTNMDNMFYNCQALKTVPHFETSRVNNMIEMFYYCRNLQTVPQFETNNVTSMDGMFEFCFSLKIVPQFATNNVTSMEFLFYNCSKLETVPLLNFSSVNNNYNMFSSCTSLTNLGGFTGLKVDLNLSSSSKLTVDSVMNVINAAADMTSEPQTLRLHKDVFNKLSADQIATATAKGWNIASR